MVAMLNKNFTVKCANTYNLILHVEETATNTSKNKSTIKYRLYIQNTSGTYHWERITTKQTLVINGVSLLNRSEQETIPIGGTVTLVEGTLDIGHNSDGKKSVSYSFSASQTVSYGIGNVSGSGTFSLTDIPRASVVSVSPAEQFVGKNITVNTNAKDSSFRHKIRVKYGNENIPEMSADGVAGSKVLTIPYSLLNKFSLASDKITLTVYCYTYSDTAMTKGIGSGTSTTFKAKIDTADNNVKPTVNSFTLSSVDATTIAGSSYALQGTAKAKVVISATTKSSSVKTYQALIDGVTYSSTSNTITSGVLKTSGNREVKVRVQDARGIYSNWSTAKTIEIIPYIKPTINSFKAVRCDDGGTPADDGQSILVNAVITHSAIGIDSVINPLTVRFTAGGYSAIVDSEDIHQTTDNYMTTSRISGKIYDAQISPTERSIAQLKAIDSLGKESAISSVEIPTDKIVLNLGEGGNKVAFGMYAQTPKTVELERGWDLKLKDKVLNDFIYQRDVIGSPTSTDGRWDIIRYASGRKELIYRIDELTINNWTAIGNMYKSQVVITLPADISMQYTYYAQGSTSYLGTYVSVCGFSRQDSTYTFELISPTGGSKKINFFAHMLVF